MLYCNISPLWKQTKVVIHICYKILYLEYPNLSYHRLSSYINWQCVKIVNDKSTNISQKETASNTVSLAAMKSNSNRNKKKKTNKTTTTTTTVKTVVLKQIHLLFRQGLSTFCWPSLSRFVEGIVTFYVFSLLFGTWSITAASFYTINFNKPFYAMINF